MIDQALANAAVGRTEPVRMFELLAWCRQQAVARGLKPVESHLLLTLATYCDDEATCWPSIKRLAADIGPLRSMIWQRVKAETGFEGDLYLATRHFAGWYMTNILELDAGVVAAVLGHTDGGKLVQTLYGHLDDQRALARAQAAFEQAGTVTPIRRQG